MMEVMVWSIFFAELSYLYGFEAVITSARLRGYLAV